MTIKDFNKEVQRIVNDVKKILEDSNCEEVNTFSSEPFILHNITDRNEVSLKDLENDIIYINRILAFTFRLINSDKKVKDKMNSSDTKNIESILTEEGRNQEELVQLIKTDINRIMNGKSIENFVNELKKVLVPTRKKSNLTKPKGNTPKL